MLFREQLGEVLRELRVEQELTLRSVAKEATMALGYLSEIERGKKELSSEILNDLTKALHIDLSEVLMLVSIRLAGGVPDTLENLLDEYGDLMVRS
jgi:transcriptional regulator with XRE-family HTH domain